MRADKKAGHFANAHVKKAKTALSPYQSDYASAPDRGDGQLASYGEGFETKKWFTGTDLDACRRRLM